MSQELHSYPSTALIKLNFWDNVLTFSICTWWITSCTSGVTTKAQINCRAPRLPGPRLGCWTPNENQPKKTMWRLQPNHIPLRKCPKATKILHNLSTFLHFVFEIPKHFRYFEYYSIGTHIKHTNLKYWYFCFFLPHSYLTVNRMIFFLETIQLAKPDFFN